MSNTNDFLPFCPNDTGTNLENQSDYLVDTNRTDGNQPGVASSKLNNKALRQGTYVASQFAQFVSNVLAEDVLDNDTPAQLLAQINAILFPHAPVITTYTSGSGSWNKTYSFKIASGNATSGATYTNNGNTFTVKSTIAADIHLETTGNGAPSTGGGTLTKASGTGDSTLTFYAVQSCIYSRAIVVGGGGGGGGSTGAGGNGGNTTLGTSFLTANGGLGGLQSGASGTPASGGTATIGSGPVGVISQTGASGQGASNEQATSGQSGGMGGANLLGGAGAGGTGVNSGGTVGTNAIANSGAGGGGSGFLTGGAGGGGGAGAFIDAYISAANLPSVLAYVVGAAGSSGTGSPNGGLGAAGFICVQEFFS